MTNQREYITEIMRQSRQLRKLDPPPLTDEERQARERAYYESDLQGLEIEAMKANSYEEYIQSSKSWYDVANDERQLLQKAWIGEQAKRQELEAQRLHEWREQRITWIEVYLIYWRTLSNIKERQEKEIARITQPMITGVYRGDPMEILRQVEQLEQSTKDHERQRLELLYFLNKYMSDSPKYGELAKRLYYHGELMKVDKQEISMLCDDLIAWIDSTGERFPLPDRLQQYKTLPRV